MVPPGTLSSKLLRSEKMRPVQQGRPADRQFFPPVADGFVYEIRHCADLFLAGESDLIPWQDTIDCTGISMH